ncbi:Enolase, C-terminal TIM barrel domain-containing protein [Pestalotiopsis sp. NC0098]|nr:Enolase, C-terminal TIM barrel domain-containing protein [Pestalotiopsis sp. NC0098]
MIQSIHAAQRLDSRGNPTVQVDVVTSEGSFRAIVPSGASTGATEATELRDNVEDVYQGKGVHTAVRNVNEIIGPAVVDKKFDVKTQLKDIDNFMRSLDGTPNKSKLGANAILGVSMACARAGAAALGVPLYEFLRKEAGLPEGDVIMPVPFFNVLNGGAHSGNAMAFQEFMIAPVGASSMEAAVRMGAETYHQLKKVIVQKWGPSAAGLGDEGGFAPPIHEPREALDLLTAAVEQTGYTGRIKFGIDPASTEFFSDGQYDLGFKDEKPRKMDYESLAAVYDELLRDYPVVLLEDPFAEDDWSSWTDYNKRCPVELVGDDLLTTNVERVNMAQERKACNSMLLKVNQIGTISESIEANNLCGRLGWNVFVSHRSGETTDDFLADVVVGLGTGHLKSGAPARGERVAKYNRLMDIEEELLAQGKLCTYAGTHFNDLSKLKKT